MVLQNYKKIIEMTANMIYIVALGVGLKCPRKKTKCHVITFHCKDVIPPLNGL
mgnify:CR=1 FL=1